MHKEIEKIAQESKLSSLEIYKQFLRLGLTTYNLQEKPNEGVYLRTEDGEFQRIFVGKTYTIDDILNTMR